MKASAGAERAGATIVTGAAGGIGLACALAASAAGRQVVAVDVKPRPAELPAAIQFLRGSVTEPAVAKEAVAMAEAAPSVLDGLVNAAGIADLSGDGSIADIELEVWRRTLAVNLEGAMLFSREALKVMRGRRGGALVHIASVAGLRGMDDPMDAYQVSKAGLVGLSRAIAVQYAALGIRSNTVCPGAVLTPLIEPLYDADEERKQRMERRTPLGRIGTPEEIAAVCLFLLSEASGFMTGTDLVADGGLLAVLP